MDTRSASREEKDIFCNNYRFNYCDVNCPRHLHNFLKKVPYHRETHLTRYGPFSRIYKLKLLTSNQLPNLLDLQGPQGIPGVKGDTGAVGPQGPQGIPGEKGDTGSCRSKWS